jgi:hypothetical protein
MQRVVFLSLMLLLLSSGSYPTREEEVIYARISYINGLKRFIDKAVWKGLANEKFAFSSSIRPSLPTSRKT